MPQNSVAIILDTDIGDDIDDALALVVALNSPEIKLVGVTTVFRDALKRALLARHVLQLLQRDDVPVFAGCSEPLLADWENFPDGKSLGKQFEALDASLVCEEARHAVDFLIESARDFNARNEVLTFVTIGALTNIALAFHMAPDIISACKIVMMGGNWSENFPEWNILCDPEAAAMVFSSGADIRMVGLDVTLQCVLSKEQEQLFNNSPNESARFLGELISLWGHDVTIHDPLTVLTLFSDIVDFQPMHLEIGLHDQQTRARTLVSAGKPNVLAATKVRVDEAIAWFLERALRSA